jgi:AraC family transcriptional regulator
MVELEPGIFLGVMVDSFQDNGLRLNRTDYLPDQPTGVMHYHPNTHISLVLQGGNIEKKGAAQLERIPGCVTFYQPGEAHQTIHKQFPAQHINLEIDDSFWSHYQITNQQVGNGIQPTPDCAITILIFMVDALYHYL